MAIRGWVYVITNKAMPGLVKIGYSTKDPILRAEELKNTGSPHACEVAYDALVVEPRSLEQTVHVALSGKREGKEWFSCTIEEAIAEIRSLAAGKIIVENVQVTLTEAKTPQPATCEYRGCQEAGDRSYEGRTYCLWHWRQMRNPGREYSIQRLQSEIEAESKKTT